jgi:HD-like signal output (HDOD) protein
MVAVGAVTKLTAQRVGMPNYEEAFVAGLLHDFGIILLDQYAHTHFERALLKAGEEQRPFCDAERETLGFDHAALGVAIATKWRFPASILAAIKFHHRSLAAPVEHRQLTCCVELANTICTRKGYSSIGLPHVPAPNAASLATIKITRDGLAVLLDKVHETIERHAVLMNPWGASDHG